MWFLIRATEKELIPYPLPLNFKCNISIYVPIVSTLPSARLWCSALVRSVECWISPCCNFIVPLPHFQPSCGTFPLAPRAPNTPSTRRLVTSALQIKPNYLWWLTSHFKFVFRAGDFNVIRFLFFFLSNCCLWQISAVIDRYFSMFDIWRMEFFISNICQRFEMISKSTFGIQDTFVIELYNNVKKVDRNISGVSKLLKFTEKRR